MYLHLNQNEAIS
jgi:serine/threonine protein kinase